LLFADPAGLREEIEDPKAISQAAIGQRGTRPCEGRSRTAQNLDRAPAIS
jgi:hypothetical protein